MSRSRETLTVIFVALLLHGIFTVGLPWWLLASTSEAAWSRLPLGPARWLGLGSCGFGAYLYVWAAVRLVTRRTSALPLQAASALETKGWYSVVRHPLLLGVVLILLGEALVFESWVLLAYGCVYWLGVDRFVVRPEETQLHASFGDGYRRYAAQVPRWIPRTSRR